MSDDKLKKLRIYKFAAEYNLSTDSLVEFLKSKNYSVKSHASLLTDEMIDDIRAHFKKDIEKSEHHYRKITEFQRSLGNIKKEEEPVSTKEPEIVEVVEPVHENEKEEIINVEVVEVKAPIIEETTEENVEEKNVAEVDKGAIVQAASVEEKTGSFNSI